MPELLASLCPNGEYTDYLLKGGQFTGNNVTDLSSMDIDPKLEKNLTLLVLILVCNLRRGITYIPTCIICKIWAKIRLQDDINQSRQATCLDSALLFAGCLGQAGLNVVLVFTEGHAMVGYWLIDKTLTGLTSNDPVDLRNRVAMKMSSFLKPHLL